MRIKNIFRKLHLILGLASGLVVFIVAVTGCLYAFEEELRNLIHSELMHAEPAAGPAKPFSELMRSVKEEFPKPGIKNVRVKADPGSSVEFILKNKESVFIDPYTGKVLGSYNKETDFFGVMLKIHRSLYLGDPGKIITGTSAVIFIIMLISGIILWWPKNKALLRQKLSVKRNASWKRREYDLHSVLGFYASWILIFSALTGIIWSFKWAENTMYWLNGSKKEERRQHHSPYSAGAKTLAIDRIIERSGILYAQSEERFISLPEDSAGVFRVSFRYNSEGFYKKQDQLFFDQYSGQLIRAQLYEQSSAGDKMKATNYDLHTGKVFGITGQLIIFLAGLIAASLPVTGFRMWLSKRRRK